MAAASPGTYGVARFDRQRGTRPLVSHEPEGLGPMNETTSTRAGRSAVAVVVVALLAGALLAPGNRLHAQMPPDVVPVMSLPRPAAVAVRASQRPVIDGALGDPAWADAIPLTGFVQSDPFEGRPASERTEVRILYDDEAIYIGVLCYDSEPGRIVATDTSRDADLDGQDSFSFILDTFRDQQNGFVFGTTAAGIEYDAQVRNQGSPTTTWDGSWEVRTQITEEGWSAEFRIPLRTLRYGPPPQMWGVNFKRTIPRSRETSYWAPLARIYGLNRLSSAGELSDLELSRPGNLMVLPYVVGSANRDYVPGGATDVAGDFGIDAKFGITPGLALDVTYNTDFAQVEADTEQINLTRFNLRFPERRPFFLENSALFRVGQGNEIDLFFTRRIGLADNGSLVPIVGGARMSGRAAGLNVGLLNMQTDELETRSANNYSTVRVNRELPNRSSLGVMFVNRVGTGAMAGADDWNRTWGLDGAVGLGERVAASAFVARTETPGAVGREHAYHSTIGYNDGRFQLDFDYGLTGEAFNPEVGFVQRDGGYSRWRAQIRHTMRSDRLSAWGFREFHPHIWYRRYDDLDGNLLVADLHADWYWDWEKGFWLSTGLMGTWEGLASPFQIYPGVVVPAGEHGGLWFQTRQRTDARRPVSFQHEWSVGRFLTGHRNNFAPQLTIRDGGRVVVNLGWSRNNIDLPEGRFSTNLGSMRMTYNFTPLVFLSSLVQYNDRTERWSANVRFHWLETAGTGLFLVYNTTESLEGLGPVNRAFIVKYSRRFDVLR